MELMVQLTDLVGEGLDGVTWAWQMLTCTKELASVAAWASLAVMWSRPGPGSRRLVLVDH